MRYVNDRSRVRFPAEVRPSFIIFKERVTLIRQTLLSFVSLNRTQAKLTRPDFEFLTTNKDIKIQCCICFESISFFMHCEGIHDAAPLSRFSVFEALGCGEHVHGFSLDSDLLRTTTHSVLRIKIPKIISVT